MGGCSSRDPVPRPRDAVPRRPPNRGGGGVGGGVGRVILEELIRFIIQEVIRKQRENEGYRLKQLSQNCMMKSWEGESTISEIPSEYIYEMQQNPEGLIRSLNIEVPPELMPEVAAALADFGRRGAAPVLGLSP